jgi:hypothetical protein
MPGIAIYNTGFSPHAPSRWACPDHELTQSHEGPLFVPKYQPLPKPLYMSSALPSILCQLPVEEVLDKSLISRPIYKT